MKKTDSLKIVISVLLLISSLSCNSQNCGFYDNLMFKNGVCYHMFKVNYMGVGKCPLTKFIPDLGYIPNSSMDFIFANRKYYIPMEDDVRTILKLNRLLHKKISCIQIKVKFYENEKEENKPFAIIKDVFAYKENDKWIKF